MKPQTYGKNEFRTRRAHFILFLRGKIFDMLNIAIVTGGDSGEYGISVKSGKQVELNIDRTKFCPFLIMIRGKRWTYAIEKKVFPIDKNDFSLTIGSRKIRFDAVFNAIHGTPGENGKLQGYFDMLGIPYTSCDVTTSALTFNKSYCKDVVANCGIKTARSLHLVKGNDLQAQEILNKLTLPLFVKPNNGGSSVGMSKVNQASELEAALTLAFQEDDEILIEEFVKGRELTCGVLRTEGKIIALPVTEIIPKKEYFDYEAKYKKGMCEEVVPAQVPVTVSDECQSISRMLFEKLNCKGVVRFDYIFTGSDFWFLEVNTVPGLTKASIVPNMARAHGWSFTELITRLIDELKINN
jgi:D-alanine-D-alanine ligase